MRPFRRHAAFLFFSLALSALTAIGAESPPAAAIIGEKIEGFSLPDISGKLISLADLSDKKAVVVVFVGTECPVNNAYLQRLAELSNEYRSQGVQFLAVNANSQDTAERVAEHARERQIPFPVLKDQGNVVADLFTAERTPEAFVLDRERRVRYRGRIDDQYGVGYRRPQPTRRDLALRARRSIGGPVCLATGDARRQLPHRAIRQTGARGDHHLCQARRSALAAALPRLPSTEPDRTDGAADLPRRQSLVGHDPRSR